MAEGYRYKHFQHKPLGSTVTSKIENTGLFLREGTRQNAQEYSVLTGDNYRMVTMASRLGQEAMPGIRCG